MSGLVPEAAGDILAACQAGAAELAPALGRTLDGHFELTIGTPGAWEPGEVGGELDGPGLAILLLVQGRGAVAFLAESSGFLPDWYAQPDATGKSKLTTLAQEMGMLLLPEQLMPEDFQAARVPHLAQGIERAGIGAGACQLPIALSTSDGKRGNLWLLWPAVSPDELFNATEASTEVSPPRPASHTPPTPVPKASPPPDPTRQSAAIAAELPPYMRSLLRIRVPVIVTLAAKRQPLKRIVELRPGSIIQFNKSCDELLDLEVEGQAIAAGECVKVGDKFGLRIVSMKSPAERYHSLRSPRA